MTKSIITLPPLYPSTPVPHTPMAARDGAGQVSKYWCFTLNNYTEDEQQAVRDLEAESEYLVFGREVGDSGTPHLQGFIVFPRKKRRSAVSRLIPRAHLEMKRGTVQQAADYCKEDGDFEEFGEPPEDQVEKSKTDWAAVLIAAKEGDFDSIPPCAYIHCRRTLKEIRREVLTASCPPNLVAPCGIWLTGPAGSGKSLYARTTWPDAYLKPINKWWDGYAGEETVILEDWDHSNSATLHNLKIWADAYQFPAEIKGDTIKLRPKRIVVTSNFTIEELCVNQDKMKEPLLRRFTVTHFRVAASGI